jgi:hypothetical protein
MNKLAKTATTGATSGQTGSFNFYTAREKSQDLYGIFNKKRQPGKTAQCLYHCGHP